MHSIYIQMYYNQNKHTHSSFLYTRFLRVQTPAGISTIPREIFFD